MARKAGAAKQKSPRDALIEAALNLARNDAWPGASMESLAEAAGISADEALAEFSSKAALVAALLEQARAASVARPRPEVSLSPKDRIFDALMDCFDVLKPQREGIGPMLAHYRWRPGSGLPVGAALLAIAGTALTRANVPAGGVTGALRLAELTRIISAVFPVFAADDEGLSRTMAALDQRLRDAEAWARRFGWSDG